MNQQNVFEQIAEPIQAIMNFMKEYYPNNFEFTITSNYANLRSALSVVTFVADVPQEETKEEIEQKIHKAIEDDDIGITD